MMRKPKLLSLLLLLLLLLLQWMATAVRGEPGSEEADSEAGHVFVGANVLLFDVIVCTCLFIGYVLKRHKLFYLPDSSAAMILGFVIGAFTVFFGNQEGEYVMFRPEVFFYGLLPPIIFDAGYSMEKRQFFANMSTILLFAVVGTLISTIVIGYGLYGLARAGAVPLNDSNPLEALMFGALISAVDPVATLAILTNQHINADPVLSSVVFGESVLNDAVSITLFNTLKSQTDIAELDVGGVFLQFTMTSLGSVLIGAVFALALAFILRHATMLRSIYSYEFALVFLFAYASYCLAEIMGLSGIMALFFCGIFMSHYTYYNLSPQSKVSTTYAFKSFALVCESFVFAYMGMTAVVAARPQYHLQWSVPLMIFTLVLCFVSRACNIFPLAVLANLGRAKAISFKMMVFMCFAGLRGAIAFALSLNMPTEHSSAIVTTTMIIVIFTTLVMGGLTEPLLKRLDLKQSNYQQVRQQQQQHDAQIDEQPSRLKRFWINLDEQHMQPLFGGQTQVEPGSDDDSDFLLSEDDDRRRDHGDRGRRRMRELQPRDIEMAVYGTPHRPGDRSDSSADERKDDRTGSNGQQRYTNGASRMTVSTKSSRRSELHPPRMPSTSPPSSSPKYPHSGTPVRKHSRRTGSCDLKREAQYVLKQDGNGTPSGH